MLETITFALAMLGFALLTLSAGLAARGGGSRWLSIATAVTVVLHVFLVWAFRYEWSFAEATRNGYAGFGIFHLALASIALGTIVNRNAARWLTMASFCVVCVGASGAVFRYEVVAIYRIPVLACVVLGALAATTGLYKTQRAANSAP